MAKKSVVIMPKTQKILSAMGRDYNSIKEIG